MISATALCTFRSPRWTLALLERMCFATEFTCLRFPVLFFLNLSSRRVYLSWREHFRAGRQRSFSVANSQNSLKDRCICDWGDLNCPGRSCMNHACNYKIMCFRESGKAGDKSINAFVSLLISSVESVPYKGFVQLFKGEFVERLYYLCQVVVHQALVQCQT